MNLLDDSILAILSGSTLIGVFKGFIRQVLTILGIIVVATLTATVMPYAKSLLTDIISNDSARNLAAMIASALLLVIF